ncbi:putative membrane protein [Nostoc sp. PCC 7524]|nr:putative membrane protein [Nostoc sp. PCC 7524]
MRHSAPVQSWLRFLMIFLLVLGILFRFCKIDRKVYSINEVYTTLNVAGYRVSEVKQQIFNGDVIDQEILLKFQSLNLERDFGDTIISLAKEEPPKTPLYYIIARFWVEIFGNSVTTIRYLSALMSLLVFPCVYWLCRELFILPLSLPSLAIALMAISPIHLIYAQEAQEYILWLNTILVSSAALLRAIRLEAKPELSTGQKSPDTFTTWGMYTITLALSLYTCLWSVFVVVAHGIYVILLSNFRLSPTVRSYLLGIVLGFLAFVPWIIIVVAHIFQFILAADSKNIEQVTLLPLISFLLMQVSRIFFDLNFGLDNPVITIIALFYLILVGYAIYFICKTTNDKVRLFIVTMIVVPSLPLILPHLFAGGIRADSEPYFIPAYLGIQLAVTYLLAIQIDSANTSRRRYWQIIMAIVIIFGLISSRVYYQTATWWHK